MVAIAEGCFEMGSTTAERGRGIDEGQHRVCHDAFKIDRHEVTFADYDLFCDLTGRARPDDLGWGRGDRPVLNVSWHEATAYAEWVSQVAGWHFRLPTEAQWEAAARAGTATAYWWGDEIGYNQANCSGCGSPWGGRQTAPVGSFPSNPWGLDDTAGNVWEWTCSAYGDYDGRRETICAEKDDPHNRVLRGGSWYYGPLAVRTANREGYGAASRGDDFGFRLIQD